MFNTQIIIYFKVQFRIGSSDNDEAIREDTSESVPHPDSIDIALPVMHDLLELDASNTTATETSEGM